MNEIRLWGGKVRKPQESRLAKIQRDRDGPVECEQERHLDQKRQTPAQRITFLHQSQLFDLQLLKPRIVLLHPLDLFLQLFHARRQLLRLFHRLRRTPLQRKEEGVNNYREQDDGNAVTAGKFLQPLDRAENWHGERA